MVGGRAEHTDSIACAFARQRLQPQPLYRQWPSRRYQGQSLTWCFLRWSEQNRLDHSFPPFVHVRSHFHVDCTEPPSIVCHRAANLPPDTGSNFTSLYSALSSRILSLCGLLAQATSFYLTSQTSRPRNRVNPISRPVAQLIGHSYRNQSRIHLRPLT